MPTLTFTTTDDVDGVSRVSAEGDPEAIRGMYTTLADSLAEALRSEPSWPQRKGRDIAFLVVHIAALLDAHPGHIEKDWAGDKRAEFSQLAIWAYGYLSGQLQVAQRQYASNKQRLRAVADEYGEAYFQFNWWRFLQTDAPCPQPIAVEPPSA